MNKLLATLALVSSLAFPALASATGSTPSSVVESDADSFSFTLATTSAVSIGYTWSDMLVKTTNYVFLFPTSSTTSAKDGVLSWTLTGATSLSGVLTDPSNQSSGTGTLSFASLAAGTYKLTLTGNWQTTTGSSGNLWNWSKSTVVGQGDVNLLDGDRVNCKTELNTFTATAVAAPVPEPETYAMLIAGLGLMAGIARRRSRNAA